MSTQHIITGPYSQLASRVFGVPLSEVTTRQRVVVKRAVLMWTHCCTPLSDRTDKGLAARWRAVMDELEAAPLPALLLMEALQECVIESSPQGSL